MRITKDELRTLLGLLDVTEPEELNCEEFLAEVPGYLEKLRTLDVPRIAGYESFLHHLKICPECLEEFEGLCEAMRQGLL